MVWVTFLDDVGNVAQARNVDNVFSIFNLICWMTDRQERDWQRGGGRYAC